MPHIIGATLSPRREPSVRVTVNVTDPTPGPEDPAPELHRWLGGQEHLRGRVHVVEHRRQSGALTQTVVSLAADLGPPGLAALGTALVTWLRHRTSDVRVSIRRQDGTRFELSARRVRGMGQAEITALVDQLADRAS
jgi:hypothetical protein